MKKNCIYINWQMLAPSLIILLLVSLPSMAQEENKEETVEKADDGLKPARPAFESTWIIDNQTVIVPSKGTLEFMIQHRFGTVSNGVTDMWGLYAPSNIRLGLSYTLFGKLGFGSFKGPLSLGIGSTKDNRIQDINIKYAFLQQTRNSRTPVSVTYFLNTGIETLKPKEELPNGNSSDRLSYFHQLLISRRFSDKISIQVAPSVSHYNVVEPGMNNDHFAIAFSGRYKFSAQSSVMVNVDQPITKHEQNNPQPNVSIGFEVSTSAHSFQIFVTNFSAIAPQRNNMYNQNDPWDKGWRIGFNINRLWNF